MPVTKESIDLYDRQRMNTRRYFETKDKGFHDIQPGALWDSLTIKPSLIPATEHVLYQVPIGHPEPLTGQTRTLRETNMVQPGMLPAPTSFLVSRVLFTFSRDTWEEDVYQFAESTVFQFEIGQKWYLRSNIISLPTTRNNIKAPIRICDFCRSVYVMDPQCPGCGARQFHLTSHLAEMPFEEGGRQYYFQIPEGNELVIEYHLHFGMRLYTGCILNHPLKLWCHLEGLEKRMVQ